jgi:hypothetical protein
MFGFLRRFTDRPVKCRKCGEHIGYVTLFGHKRWEHVACPPDSPVRAI